MKILVAIKKKKSQWRSEPKVNENFKILKNDEELINIDQEQSKFIKVYLLCYEIVSLNFSTCDLKKKKVVFFLKICTVAGFI